MKRFAYIIIFGFILYNVYLCCFSVLNHEVNLFNDVARDFLLLQEMSTKKIVLIGPRSNTNGVFHGPLWTYINYPAYVLGGGDPVFQAWFWIFLELVFLASSFYIGKKLFNTFTGLSFALLLSVRMVPHINGVFHSEVTFFMVPVFFYTAAEFIKTKKLKFLIGNIASTCALTQLNIGVGMSFLILTIPLLSYFIFKDKKYKSFLYFFLYPVFLSNFILFDLKHNFGMLKALLGTGGSSKFFIPISDWILNRITNTASLELFDGSGYENWSYIIFVAVIVCTIIEIKINKKLRSTYLLFLYFYLGYMVLSYFNKGILLYHYIYLLIPLTYLWVVSFLRGRYKFIFVAFLLIIFALNLQNAKDYNFFLKNNFIDKNPNSWIGLSKTAKTTLEMAKGQEFGYFVFSPDAFAYQPRYAMIYNFKASKAREYTKLQNTFVIAQPPPANDPYMDYKWWVKVQVGISKSPEEIKTLPNGYKILRYKLSADEQKVPFDHNIELGIHFR